MPTPKYPLEAYLCTLAGPVSLEEANALLASHSAAFRIEHSAGRYSIQGRTFSTPTSALEYGAFCLQLKPLGELT